MRLICSAIMSVVVLVPQPLFAQSSVPNAQGDLSVTIYNNDLALVQDVRRITLPSGRSRQEFPDVSARIRPETRGLNSPLT